VGRTGALTPVAHLRPVFVAGSTVSRATLHNFDEINRKDIRIGDSVVLQKAGDVIPEIVEPLAKLRSGVEKKVERPTVCPICGSPVVKDRDVVALYCSNKNCFARDYEKILHFCSKKGFNIVGLGEKIVESLVNQGLVSSFSDIFELKAGDLALLPGFKQKKTENLLQAIETAKKVSLPKFIFSLGIRYVGEENALLLARLLYSHSLSEFIKQVSALSVADLQDVDGIGEKVGQSFVTYFQDAKNIAMLRKFEALGVIALPLEKEKSQKLHGQTFVITGTLSLPRNEIKELLQKNGAKVSGSVSRSTSYVICGENPGSKYDEARQLGVKILDEKDLMLLIK